MPLFFIMKTKVYLSLGSNSGDRRAFLRRAVAAIGELGSVRASGEYANAPQGFESPNEFVNMAVELTMERRRPWNEPDAEALLAKLKAIERSISAMPHRCPDGSYRDREIDIDIIAIEGFAMASPTLTLPHPRAAERPFVVIPLSELTDQAYGLCGGVGRVGD